jgi:hypothetical protein
MTGNRFQEKTIATFEEARTQALIQNPSDYYMSVVRFSLDAKWIPLFVCPVVVNPFNTNDVNTTPYNITLTYGNNEFEVPLIFTPENDEPIPPPPTNINLQNLQSSYYFMYSYNTFVTMINTAIYKLFHGYNDQFINPIAPYHVNGLFDVVPGLSGIPIPYFIYDPITTRFSYVVPNIDNPLVPGGNLYLTQYGLDNKPVLGAQAIYLFLNEELNSLIDGLEYFSLNGFTEVLLVVKDYKNNYYYPPQYAGDSAPQQTLVNFSTSTTVVTPPPNSETFTYTAAPVWFIFTQQYQTIELFNSIAEIVFLTSTLPIQPEYLPSSAVVGSNASQSGNIAFRPVLTDFVVPASTAGDVRSRLIYNPQGPYRLIDMHSHIPLVKVDLKIYWSDQYNNLYPMYISYNQSDTIKLMFIKKSMANYNYRTI